MEYLRFYPAVSSSFISIQFINKVYCKTIHILANRDKEIYSRGRNKKHFIAAIWNNYDKLGQDIADQRH